MAESEVGNEASIDAQSLEDTELAEMVLKRLRQAREMVAEQRKEMEEAYNMYAGHQWEEAVKTKLKAEGRPALTFNYEAAMIDVVVGSEIHNRQAIRFVPRRPQDSTPYRKPEEKPPAPPIPPGAPPQAGPPGMGPGGPQMGPSAGNPPLPGGGPEAPGMGQVPPHPQVSLPITWLPPERDPSVEADLASDAKSWAYDRCSAEDQLSECFKDILIPGIACFHQRMDYDFDQDGMWIGERVRPQEMSWDQAARRPDFLDARWVDRSKWISKEEFKERWPDKEKFLSLAQSDIDPLDGEDAPYRIRNENPIPYSPGHQEVTATLQGPPKSFLKIHEHQYWEREDIYRVETDDGEQFFPKDEFDRWKEAREAAGMPTDYVKQQRRVYKRCFTSGRLLLEKDDLEPAGGFTYQLRGFKFDEKKKVWYGASRHLHDPQFAANKWLSQAVHIFSTSPKNPLIYKTGVFANPQVVEQRWSGVGATIQASAESNLQTDILSIQANPLSPAAMELVQHSFQALRWVSGINVEVMGLSEGDQPGVTMRQRQTQGMTVLAQAFNALTELKKRAALLTVKFIREFVAADKSPGRLIRIGGEFDSKAVELLKDRFSEEYDLIVDDNPRNPNTKMEVWQLFQGIMPILVKTGKFPEHVMDYFPGPAVTAHRIKEDIRKMNEQAANAPPQQKGRGQAKDPREVEATIGLKKAQERLTLTRAAALDQEAQLDQVVKTSGMRREDEAHQAQMAKTMAGIQHERLSTHASAMAKMLGAQKRLLNPGYPA